MGQQMFVLLACFALAVWTLAPSSSHTPKTIETQQEHAEMVSDHGHSHGFEEDLIWAMHGHGHDVSDHDHTQASLPLGRAVEIFVAYRSTWQGFASSHGPPPLYRLDRPPRA